MKDDPPKPDAWATYLERLDRDSKLRAEHGLALLDEVRAQTQHLALIAKALVDIAAMLEEREERDG